jgi:hypothetical protein
MTTTQQPKTAEQIEAAEYAARVAAQLAAHRAKMDDDEREIEDFYVRVYEA